MLPLSSQEDVVEATTETSVPGGAYMPIFTARSVKG